ncbi:MAG TPA: tetratricopeptide repeat protein [Candidatus Aminicenantes bacterium]|nr:tetratricopeptide repeat protein [Candidatus Aminicenantes bacterium]
MAPGLKPLPALLLLAALARPLGAWHWFEPAARRNQKGIEAFRKGDFAAALEQFLSAKGLKPEEPRLKNNTAEALYQLKKYKEALNELASADAARLGPARAAFHYNLGNVQYRLGQYPQALESYKRSLKLAPDDVPAKKNYELTLKKIQEQQQQQQPQPQQQQDQAEQQKQKYEAMMQFLNQNEKEQQQKRKHKAEPARNEKDW